MTPREARRIASALPLSQAKVLAGFVSKDWPHHGAPLDDWYALEAADLVYSFKPTVKGLAVGKAALRIFDSVSLDPDRFPEDRVAGNTHPQLAATSGT